MTTQTQPTQLNQQEVDDLIHRTEILAAGLSNMYGVYLTPGSGWSADVESGEITYDLGLAAVLNRNQQTGVALHEIAHLRYTAKANVPRRLAGRDARWAKFAHNLFEDCRIERRLRDEYPGAGTFLGELRATFNRPHMAATLAYAEPHMQFLNALYAIIFDDPSWTSDPDVFKKVEEYRDEALDLREAKSSPLLMRKLCRDGGIVDALIEIRDRHTQKDWELALDGDEEAAEEALADANEPEPDAGVTQEQIEEAIEELAGGEAAAGEDADVTPDGEPVGGPGAAPEDDGAMEDDDGAMEPVEAKGDAPHAGQPDDAQVPDPDQFMPEPDPDAPVVLEEPDDGGGIRDDSDDLRGVGDDDGGQGDSDGAGGSGIGERAAEEAIDPDDPFGDPYGDEQELAAMTEQQREVLNELLNSIPRTGEEPEGFKPMDEDLMQPPGEVADEVQSRIDGSRRMVGDVGDAIRRVVAQRDTTADDRLHRLEDDYERYELFWENVYEAGDVLGRRLDSVLLENRQDRWSAIGYESGGRLHGQNMSRVPARETRIFRRKTRAKNRQFAVSILQDVSVSMNVSQMAHATSAGILIAEGLDRVKGVDFAYYAFGSNNACLKPYTHSLEQRAAKIGAMGTLQTKIGGSTAMAPAMNRAGSDALMRHGGADWQRVMIVITDGQPDSPVAVQSAVRELTVRYGFSVIGIGIQTAGQLAQIMPTWVAVTDSAMLAPELVRVLRRAVTKG